MIQIYHNNRCGKSRECVSHFENLGVQTEIIDYLKNPPTEAEIKQLLIKLKIQPIDLIRTNEKIWKENYAKLKMSENELISAMAQHPILIQRPIVISGENAVIARPLSVVAQII